MAYGSMRGSGYKEADEEVSNDGHRGIFEDNCGEILRSSYGDALKDRNPSLFGQIELRKMSASTRSDYAELQRDLGGLVVLIDNAYPIEESILSDFYDQAVTYIPSIVRSPTDEQIAFPTIVKDAIKSLKTNGIEPPSQDLSLARDTIISRTQGVLDLRSQ